MVERTLARGPADVLALVEAVRTAVPQAAESREGCVHALLHRLVKDGRVVVDGRSRDGLPLYRAAGTPAQGDMGASEPPVAQGKRAQAAARIASAVRDPAARGRIQADIAAHLGALDEAGHGQRFGAVRAVRHLLHRVDRGRPTVVLTATGGDTVRRILLHEGPWLLGATLLFFVLKLFIVPIYHIPSKSMLPTLQVDDRVAVFLPNIGGVPERWSIVTYDKGGTTYVKRLVGLPGEEIAILHGDVFIDGKLLVKPDEVREALRSHVGAWEFGKDTPRGWGQPVERAGGRSWTWRSGGFAAHPPSELGNSYVLRDGYARLRGERGERGGLVLELRRGPGGSAEGEVLTWTLEVGLQGIVLREERSKDEELLAPPEVLASRQAPPSAGPLELRLSYVDGVLRAACADWSWQGGRAAPDAALGLTVGERGPGSRVLDVAVDRDLHYAHLGTQGVPHGGHPARNAHRISKQGVFCMGDNTTDSRDSRYRDPGDIPVDDLIGRVRVRIWPVSRWGLVR